MRRTIIAVSAIGTVAIIIVAVFIGAGINARHAKAATPDFSLVGYATVNGTTTGGAGGPTVTVTTLSQLQSAAASSGPSIIQVSGTISGSGDITVTSNKTIIGVGSSGQLIGLGLDMTGNTSNVIIRNLSISKVTAASGNGDAIHIEGTGVNHIWVDHNDLSSDTSHGKDFYDGLVDITHGADFVTVSWNVFHDHYKTSLVGHSDSNGAEDTGHLHVTYHHNYFFNIDSRAPSIRFGTLHSFDNYFLNFFNGDTGISSRMGACSRIEDDYFDGVKTPILTDQSSQTGSVQLINDTFVNETSHATSPTCSLNVPYAYSNVLQDVSQVPTIVPQFSGVGKLSGGSSTATPVPPTSTPSSGTPTATPRPPTPTPTPSSGGNGVTATGSVASSSGFFGEEDVTVGNTSSITALTATVTIQKTTGVTFGGQYNTVGGQIAMTHTDNGATIVYTFTLSNGQTLGAGTGKLFAAQFSGTGTAHPTTGDIWSVTATSNGSTTTLNGHF
jgi:pectate lyase